MNDQDMIIYNYIGVQKISFNHQIRQHVLDTFQMKFLDSREIVAK